MSELERRLQELFPDDHQGAAEWFQQEGHAGEWPNRWVLLLVNGKYTVMSDRDAGVVNWPEGTEVEYL